MPEDEIPYVKRWTHGKHDVRILNDVGKFSAQIYVDNRREDTLTHPSMTELVAKVQRYLAGEASQSEIKRLTAELESAQGDVKRLTTAINKVGDGNAKAAELESQLVKANEKIDEQRDRIAQLESDLSETQAELKSAKSVKTKTTKTNE